MGGLSGGWGFGLSGFGGLGYFFAFPFLESADGGGGKLKLNLLATNHDGLLLKVWLPDLAGLLLRERYIVTELLAFDCNVACVAHERFP